MIWRTRFSSLAVSTRPQNETVSSKCSALQQWRRHPEAARSRVEHRKANVQRNLTRLLYRANGQSPEAGFLARLLATHGIRGTMLAGHDAEETPGGLKARL